MGTPESLGQCLGCDAPIKKKDYDVKTGQYVCPKCGRWNSRFELEVPPEDGEKGDDDAAGV